MTVNTFAARAAALAIPLTVVASAQAQDTNLVSSPMLTYKAGSGVNNRTLLIASAIILFVGLVDSNSALIIIGGVGVLVSTANTSSYRYRLQNYHQDLASSGRFSFGIAPFSQGEMKFSNPRPYFQASFKF